MMNKKLDSLCSSQVHLVMQCDASGTVANLEYPPYQPDPESEQTNYIGNNFRSDNNPYSNTYNPGWRNHPNLLWGGQGNQSQQPPQNFQNQPYSQEKKPNLEEMLTKFIANTENRFQETERALKDQQASVEKVTKSVREATKALEQLAKLMSEQPQGRLPSNTEINPREQIQAISAHDSKGVEEPNPIQENEVDEGKVEVTQENPKPVIKEYQPCILHPEAMKRYDTEEQFSKFLKLLRKLHIYLPLLEALSQMPDSRKFLRELLMKKRRIDENHTLTVDNALADLGASINVMPYSFFKRLGLGKPKQTRMSIKLADKTIRIPRGIIEDVLVKIDKFVFPVDFVVLDMDEDNSIPLILGRPFLASSKTKIDVVTGKLILCVGNETVTLQALDSARASNDQGEKEKSIDNHSINPSFQEAPKKGMIEPDLKFSVNKEIDHEEQRIQTDELDEWKMHFKEKLGIKETESKPLYETDKFKIEDQIVLDKANPRLFPPGPNTNKEIFFKVINVLPHRTVEVGNPNFDTLRINATQPELYQENRTVSMREDIQTFKPP
ncbi:Integrase, catalytic core [Gossypium australe]|uniref:Integrase, catalytic core n=1 Tax=Gossypium australe TaxID=47621 RepID=A0A5B6VER9_9ROSI|nr:Integrase, catalytic core [Gossypium australe]